MLSVEEIGRFDEDGCLIFDGLIAGDRLSYYTALFDELTAKAKTVAPETPHWSFEKDENGDEIPGFLHKIQGVGVVEPRALDLANEPEIQGRVAALIGEGFDVFGTKFFPKLKRGGTSVEWHQDNFYFGTNTDRIISCAIYLEKTDKANGCLRVVPGSHRDKVIHEHTPNVGGFGNRTEVDESLAVDVECSGGTVVLFSANLLHGTHPNVSDRSRYSTAWHYLPSNVALDRFPRGGYKDRHIVKAAPSTI